MVLGLVYSWRLVMKDWSWTGLTYHSSDIFLKLTWIWRYLLRSNPSWFDPAFTKDLWRFGNLKFWLPGIIYAPKMATFVNRYGTRASFQYRIPLSFLMDFPRRICSHIESINECRRAHSYVLIDKRSKSMAHSIDLIYDCKMSTA